MSRSFIKTMSHHRIFDKDEFDISKLRQKRRQQWCCIGFILAFFLAIALGLGLGIGLTRGHSNGSSSSGPVGSTNGTYWQPAVGTSFQIELSTALTDTSTVASVYDIDLFANEASTVSNLHALGRRVICYFSAGSYENFRPDSSEFQTSDYANALDGWPGEYWLNTSSANVRKIMTARLDLAVSHGCDGVDPDNVDGYDNDTGFNLTTAEAVDYLTFLATEAHARKLAIGLKNAGEIVNQTLGMMQWQINEQCEQYDECATFQPFIAAGKPVFHIEYPDSAPNVGAAAEHALCTDSSATGFTTVLKEMGLNDWIMQC